MRPSLGSSSSTVGTNAASGTGPRSCGDGGCRRRRRRFVTDCVLVTASASRRASASPRAPAPAERARPELHGERPEPVRPSRARCAPVPAASGSPAAARERQHRAVGPGTGSPLEPVRRGRCTARRGLPPEPPCAAATTVFPVVAYPPDLQAFSRSYCGFWGVSTRLYAPQAGREPVCGAPPFVIPLVTSPSRSSLRAAAPLTGRSRTGCSSPTGRLPACRRHRTESDPRPGRARSGSAPSPTSAPSSTGRPSRRSRGCRRPRACWSCRPTGSRTCRVRRPGWPANRRMRPARSSLPDRSPGCRSRRGNRTPCCGRPDPGRRPAWSG